jgi:hypothetical protein
MQVKLFQLLDVRVFFTEFEVCSFLVHSSIKYDSVGVGAGSGCGCWSVCWCVVCLGRVVVVVGFLHSYELSR